jgi:hypothetical protein
MEISVSLVGFENARRATKPLSFCGFCTQLVYEKKIHKCMKKEYESLFSALFSTLSFIQPQESVH